MAMRSVRGRPAVPSSKSEAASRSAASPDKSPPESPAPAAPDPFLIGEAIEEQQTRVWRLRGLLDAVREAGTEEGLEDHLATMDAVIEYADQIHLALDRQTIIERAAQIGADARRVLGRSEEKPR